MGETQARKPAVIFDLDGTIADTSHDLVNAANACFIGMGVGQMLDPTEDAAVAVGKGGMGMLRLGLTRMGFEGDIEAEIAAQYPNLLKAYEADIASHTVIYPGFLEAAAALREGGFAVGICTNKLEYLALQLLDALAIRKAFDAVIGADTMPTRKPDVAPLRAAIERSGGDVARALLVGDTITDHTTARAFGVPSVLVTFGPGGRVVEEMQPDHLLEHYDHLPDVAQRLLA
ncbi:MAG: HAD hydrolase-like protein [Paracoccaceae bacterium]